MSSHRSTRLLAVAALLGALVGVGAGVGTSPEPAAAQVPMDSGTTVMGQPAVTAKQLADYYYSKKGRDFARIPTLNGDVQRLAEIFIAEGKKDGVRGDIAFMQSMLETGWLEFKDYGQIRPEFNNFAGMFAYDGRPIGTTCAAEEAAEAAGGLKSRCFDSPELGVRAQIHKLRSYADPSVANTSGRLGYAPSYSRGKAPFWEQFGGASGIAIWATAQDYGGYILDRMYFPMLSRLGVTLPCSPAGANSGGDAGAGYWVVDPTGASRRFGSAPALGSAGEAGAGTPVVDVDAHPSGAGYFQVTSSGRVFAFGTGSASGSLAAANLEASAVAIEATPSGAGYWIATADGGVYSFGDAKDRGSLLRTALRSPVIDLESTPNGGGYWLLQADGAIHAFGNATDIESPRDRGTARDVVALARTPSGDGYYVLTRQGRVQAYGDAVRDGDVYGCGLGAAVAIAAAPTGSGYWVTTAKGAVFAFGSAKYLGGPASMPAGAVAFVLAG